MTSDEIDELINLIPRLEPAQLLNIRLFLISKTRMVRIYRGKHQFSWSRSDFGLLLPDSLDRGKILDCFATLEFLLNEIIQLHLLGCSADKSDCLDDLLENIDFFSRVKLLNRWNKLINDELKNIIIELKSVRNGLAHKWSEDDVNYKGGSLKANFKLFIDDLKKAWGQLIVAYRTQLEKVDLNSIKFSLGINDLISVI
jgi:hypothetical protein